MNGDARSQHEKTACYALDLAGGETRRYSVDTARALCPYKPGKLLLVLDDWSGDLPQLVVMDAVSGTFEESLPLAIGRPYCFTLDGFTYDVAADAIYYALESEVLASAGGKAFERVNFLPGFVSGDAGSAVLLPGGLYAINLSEGVRVCGVDPAALPQRVLTVSETYPSDASKAFQRDYPDVPVLFKSLGLWGAQEIAEAIRTGNTEVDVFYINSESDFFALKEKGFLADLSGSAVLEADVARMYPVFAQAVRDDQGRVVGYPVELYENAWGVDLTLWELTYPGQPLPRTWAEFLPLLAAYDDDPMDPPEYGFFRAWDLKSELFFDILNGYLLCCERDGVEPDLENPVLKDTLRMLEAIHFTETGLDDDALNEYVSGRSIFNSDNGSVFADPDAPGYGYLEPKPRIALYPKPTLQQGEQPMVTLQVGFLAVNPLSQNLELARDFVAYYVTDHYPQMSIVMHPDSNEPVRDPQFEWRLEQEERWLAEMREQLLTAKPSEVRALQERIAYWEEFLADPELFSWWISAGQIAAYRRIAEYVYVGSWPRIMRAEGDAGDTLHAALMRYLEGQADLDATLADLNRKVRMMLSE